MTSNYEKKVGYHTPRYRENITATLKQVHGYRGGHGKGLKFRVGNIPPFNNFDSKVEAPKNAQRRVSSFTCFYSLVVFV